MKLNGVVILVAMVLFAPTARPVRAQSLPPRPDSEPGDVVTDDEFQLVVTADTARDITQHISRLGSASYPEREQAGAALIEVGAVAFRQLRDAYHTTDDLEVRLRIEAIVQEAYLDHHVFRRLPFLGIERKPTLATHEIDPRIGQGLIGIGLARVINGSGARKAGLQADDVIIAFDGAPLSGGIARGFEEFAAAIRARHVGANVSLTVLRGDAQLQIQATLGSCPKSTVFNVPGGRELYFRTRRNFEVWWAAYFRNPLSSPSRLETPDQ